MALIDYEVTFRAAIAALPRTLCATERLVTGWGTSRDG